MTHFRLDYTETVKKLFLPESSEQHGICFKIKLYAYGSKTVAYRVTLFQAKWDNYNGGS